MNSRWKKIEKIVENSAKHRTFNSVERKPPIQSKGRAILSPAFRRLLRKEIWNSRTMKMETANKPMQMPIFSGLTLWMQRWRSKAKLNKRIMQVRLVSRWFHVCIFIVSHREFTFMNHDAICMESAINSKFRNN